MMARIALRAHLAEIENLITAGQAEEAIRRLRYILTLFPKAVQVYQVLAQALLANKQASEAADIFLRLLSSVPDDAGAHLGLSIIRESQGNFAQAAWHMERLAEIKPAVPSVQTELRRLIMQRDGYAPEQIPITRPGKARLYAQDGLYEPAAAELRAAIAEEPDRMDLPVYLATILAAYGDWNAAMTAGQAALEKLPYSLEANRIVCQALLSQGKNMAADPYRQQLADLDPYLAFAIDISHPEAVQDSAVSLEIP